MRGDLVKDGRSAAQPRDLAALLRGRGGLLSGRKAHAPVVLGSAPKLHKGDLQRLAPDERTPVHHLMEFPGSPLAGVLREACAQLSQSGSRRIWAVTGPMRAQGATTVALCLARTAAAWGRRTLLIDCDLRARTATLQLGLAQTEQGFWEVTRGQAAPLASAQPSFEFGFRVLPLAAPANLLRDLFSGRALNPALEALRREFDCIILDLPPVLGSVDTPMLVRNADACLLVAAHAKRKSRQVRQAAAVLTRVRAEPPYVLYAMAPRARLGENGQ